MAHGKATPQGWASQSLFEDDMVGPFGGLDVVPAVAEAPPREDQIAAVEKHAAHASPVRRGRDPLLGGRTRRSQRDELGTGVRVEAKRVRASSSVSPLASPLPSPRALPKKKEGASASKTSPNVSPPLLPKASLRSPPQMDLSSALITSPYASPLASPTAGHLDKPRDRAGGLPPGNVLTSLAGGRFRRGPPRNHGARGSSPLGSPQKSSPSSVDGRKASRSPHRDPEGGVGRTMSKSPRNRPRPYRQEMASTIEEQLVSMVVMPLPEDDRQKMASTMEEQLVGMIVMPLPEDSTPRAADNVASTAERGLQFRRDLRAKSETQIQADMAMAKILDMQQGLMNQMKTSGNLLKSAQKVVDECGGAIAKWFGALSGRALEAAIKEAFDKFDIDASGEIDREEFARAMHTLGLRLSADEYDILFQETDQDCSGAIELPEFTHMVKKFLKKFCDEDCFVCKSTGGSNQQHGGYRKGWAEDETVLNPAANVLQTRLKASIKNHEYVHTVEDERANTCKREDSAAAETAEAQQLRHRAAAAAQKQKAAEEAVARRIKTKLQEIEQQSKASTRKKRERKTQVARQPDLDVPSASSFPAADVEQKRKTQIAQQTGLADAPLSSPAAGVEQHKGAYHGKYRAGKPELSQVGVWHKTRDKPDESAMRLASDCLNPIPHPYIRKFGRTAPLKESNDTLAKVRKFNEDVYSRPGADRQGDGSRRKNDQHYRLPKPLGLMHALSRGAPGVGNSAALNYPNTVDKPLYGALTDRTGEGRRTLALFDKALRAESEKTAGIWKRNNGDEDGASLEKMAYKSEWLNMGTTGKPSVGAGNPEKAVRTSLPPLKWGTGSGRSGDEEGANPAMKHSSFFNRTGSTGKHIWRTVVDSETEDRVAVTHRSDEPPEESPRIAANGKEGQMQARFELRKPTENDLQLDVSAVLAASRGAGMHVWMKGRQRPDVFNERLSLHATPRSHGREKLPALSFSRAVSK